ncbi:MAG TPA: NAD(P)-dependent oxidoreductase [Rhizomicrobium sp.]|nr:NAD(P)-dependent oxidoreductase [Rhizomicrobium sp.]
MLPIVLDQDEIAAGLAGRGEGLKRRAALLEQAGIIPARIEADVPPDALEGLTILFIAGLERDEAALLAARARASGVLVNVEDEPALCDFHVPAIVRRGDLIVSVSTGGRAPGLARLIREWLERKLHLEWGSRLDGIGRARESWRGAGHPPAEVSRRLRAYVAEKEWL